MLQASQRKFLQRKPMRPVLRLTAPHWPRQPRLNLGPRLALIRHRLNGYLAYLA